MNRPMMPNVRSRTLPSGKKTYFLDYHDTIDDKRRRVAIGPRKADAQRKAKELYDEMMSRFVGEPERTRPNATISDLVEAFFQSKEGRISPASLNRYRILAGHFTDFMKEAFPKVKHTSDLKRVYIEELLGLLRENGQKPKTLNAELNFIKMLFKFGVEERYLYENPAERILRFRESQKAAAVQFWTEEQVRLILDSVRPHWKDIFEFLYCTGLRKGELMNLTWDDVDLKSKQPSIKIQSKDDWTTKTQSRRIVPLNKRAIVLITRQKKSDYHNYVFKGFTGGQIHRDKIYVELQRALKLLGLTGDVHKWRHTFASHLVMKGVGLETVSKLLGHSSIEMTMKYAHLAPDHLQTAVGKLPSIATD